MNISSKYFLSLVFILFLVLTGYRYYQYMIERNFTLDINTICDSKVNSCFSASEDLSYGQNPYEKVAVTARYAPVCLEEHNCDSFSCPSVLVKNSVCEITYCSDDTKEDGEECIGPINKN